MAKSGRADTFDFVMSFIAQSRRYKEQYIDRWIEVLDNFIVEPYDGLRYRNEKDVHPYRRRRNRSTRSGILLKDPETHDVIMAYAANLARKLLGDPRREYVKAEPVGLEDAPRKAPTVTRLLRHAFNQPGVFRTLVEALVDSLLFGTAVLEVGWKVREREMPVRSVRRDVETGIITFDETRQRVEVDNDIDIRLRDVQDFYPDPSHSRIEDMPGAATRFRMTGLEAKAKADRGLFNQDETTEAIRSAGQPRRDAENIARTNTTFDDRFRTNRDHPTDTSPLSDFREMIGYHYAGEVPWVDDEGSSRRRITVLNGRVVRDVPYDLADECLPWHTITINPMSGRFYGISPGEVIRFDQDFADTLKMLTAEGIVRDVHPPIAYDGDAVEDPTRLFKWAADAPIEARGGPAAVGTIPYNANFQGAFAVASMLKESMGRGHGFPESARGGEGPNREAASVGVRRFEAAASRIELNALLIENNDLPALAKAILRRYQQFLEPEDLEDRVGESPEPAWIGDIMGDFDITFSGARQAISRQERLQSIDRLVALASVIPQFRAVVNWEASARRIIGHDLELPEIAAGVGVGNAEVNKVLEEVFGQTPASNGNGAQGAGETPGIGTAQVAGGVS